MITACMARRMHLHGVIGTFFLAACFAGPMACGQIFSPFPQHEYPLPSSFKEIAARNATAPCFEPTHLPDLRDYNGPLNKAVGVFAGALEHTAARPPRYKPAVQLCTLSIHDKFRLFIHDSLDPRTFISAGLNASIDHAYDRDPRFGQGAVGYNKRYAAGLADGLSSRFFKDFMYPVIFSEDPRYYRLGRGSFQGRVLHAAGHLFIAHHSDGTRTFNYSEWLGTTTSSVLSNTYHPGNKGGFGPVASRVAFQFANDIGFDMLREFWPEISSTFKLPFKQ